MPATAKILNNNYYWEIQIILLLLITTSCIFSQNIITNDLIIKKALIDHGYNNISVAATEKNISIRFENRKWRWEPKALEEVIKITRQLLIDNDTINLEIV